MSENLELLSELDAVNTILDAVGESPIVSLEDDGTFVDAELARRMLRAAMRRIQSNEGNGWSFNTDIDVPLPPNVDGTVVLPANTLHFLQADTNITRRGDLVYDRTLRSHIFTAAITATLVSLLQFEDCPEAIRTYATIEAALRFQAQYQGDQTLYKFSQQDWVMAKSNAENAEATETNANMVTKSALASRLKQYR